jgi:hypothetical protein
MPGALLCGSKAGGKEGKGTAYLPVKKSTMAFQMSRKTLPVLALVASLVLAVASAEEPVAVLACATPDALAEVLSPMAKVVLVPYSASKALRSMRSALAAEASLPS